MGELSLKIRSNASVNGTVNLFGGTFIFYFQNARLSVKYDDTYSNILLFLDQTGCHPASVSESTPCVSSQSGWPQQSQSFPARPLSHQLSDHCKIHHHCLNPFILSYYCLKTSRAFCDSCVFVRIHVYKTRCDFFYPPVKP